MTRQICIFILFCCWTSILASQSFSGIIYQEINREPTGLHKTLAELLSITEGIPYTKELEKEFSQFEIKATICKDTMIYETYGKDSIFHTYSVYLGGKQFMMEVDSTFFELSQYEHEHIHEHWNDKHSQIILGFETSAHTQVRSDGVEVERIIAKDLFFPDSYAYGPQFKDFFSEYGIILKEESSLSKRIDVKKIHHIVLTECNCRLELEKLRFFETDNEVITTDKFLEDIISDK